MHWTLWVFAALRTAVVLLAAVRRALIIIQVPPNTMLRAR
jgi:hypothetical protein